MSNDYQIAVLLPTRGRSTALFRSVETLVDLCQNLDHLQLMLGFDTDDAVGLDHFHTTLQPWLANRGVNYTAMSFEPIGYIRLNEYVNTLAVNSSADWLVFWNDDAVMQTQNWDQQIINYTGQFKILAFRTHNDHPYSIFPIVPRAWLNVLGHLSPHQISDGWISQNAYCLDIMQRIPVHVLHDRADLTGNNLDQTYRTRPMLEGNPNNPGDFHNFSWTTKRMQECEILAGYMKSQNIDTSWWENIKANKQDPWEKLRAADVNKQMRQYQISKPASIKAINH
jgi:hypothetical protein